MIDKWIEIFRGGNQTGDNGQVYDGNHLIDRAVATFKPADHEPPVVVGHPEHDSPAFGWVSDLRQADRNGQKVLEARFKQLAPAFVEAVREGRYKQRSAAFYKDGRLRHVGFLGGQPPSVKGLAPLQFKDDPDVILIEFAEPSTPPDSGNDPAKENPMTITQEQMDAALAKLKAEKDVELKAAQDRAAAAEARFAEAEKTNRRKGYETFIDSLVKDGKALPAMKRNLVAFMEGLDAQGGTIKFAEGDGGSEQDTALADAFKKLLERFTAHPLFKNMLAPAADKPAEGGEFSDGQIFDGLTQYV